MENGREKRKKWREKTKLLGGRGKWLLRPENQPRVKWKGSSPANWSHCCKKQRHWLLWFADFKNETRIPGLCTHCCLFFFFLLSGLFYSICMIAESCLFLSKPLQLPRNSCCPFPTGESEGFCSFAAPALWAAWSKCRAQQAEAVMASSASLCPEEKGNARTWQVWKRLFSPTRSLMQWVRRLCLSRTNGRVPLLWPSCPWFTNYFSMLGHSQTVWKSNKILHLSPA